MKNIKRGADKTRKQGHTVGPWVGGLEGRDYDIEALMNDTQANLDALLRHEISKEEFIKWALINLNKYLMFMEHCWLTGRKLIHD